MAMNLADLFEHAADAFGDRIAVACGDRQVTYAELEERANRLAHHLAGLGVGPGDHVGLYARNSLEAAETLIASCKLRAAAVNINYRYVENELRYMLADADLAVLVHDRSLEPRVAAVAPGTPGLRGTVVIEDGSGAEAGAAPPPAAAARSGPGTRTHWPRPRRSGTSRRAVRTMCTSSTRAGRPATPRASCGATRTSGAPWAGASTSSPATHYRMNGRNRAAGWRPPAWSSSARRRSSTATRRWPPWPGCSPGRPSCCSRSSTPARSGGPSSGTRSTCW